MVTLLEGRHIQFFFKTYSSRTYYTTKIILIDLGKQSFQVNTICHQCWFKVEPASWTSIEPMLV